MAELPPAIDRLIRVLTTLPGVGRKSATRIALRLIGSTEAQCRELAEAIVTAKARTRACSVCGGLTEDDPCAICSDARRDPAVVCVVERASDILALERTSRFRGRYHVLGGLLSPLDGVGPADLRIDALVERARAGEIEEVILALNPTTEGEATAIYVGKLLSPLGVRVTKLASGLPVGGDLDLADELTLGTALDERRDL
jgi:recombination protein RecR